MWVRTLKAVRSIGPAGTTKNIDQPSAKTLMALGFVESAEKPEPVIPKRAYRRKDVTEDKPKRTYKRKDIVPEPDFVAENPQPQPEVTEPDDTGEDDAAVRLGD